MDGVRIMNAKSNDAKICRGIKSYEDVKECRGIEVCGDTEVHRSAEAYKGTESHKDAEQCQNVQEFQDANVCQYVKVYEKELSFSKISMYVLKAGDDYNITILGGDKPHIGSSVLAVPRLSLTGDGSVSATSSVMNMVGHKDEQICRYVAEKICAKKNAVVLCSGGFHVDDISKDGIGEVLEAVKELAEMV